MISASDPNSTYTYTYDALGDVTSVSNSGTPNVPAVTLNYGYDEYGNRTSMSDSLGGNVKYTYNADNQMTKLGLSLNGTPDAQVAFAYDAGGRLTNITRSVGGTTGGGTVPSSGGSSPAVRGGMGAYTTKGSLSGIHLSDASADDIISTSYSYDQANDLTNITSTDETTALTQASYTYGYNANGTMSSYQDNSGNSLTYGYDGNQELTSATGTLNGSSYSVSYSYEANGNRTMPGYQTGTGNELLSDGTYKYTYDHDGNTTSQTNIATGAVTYYTWDYRNRLTEVKVENSQGQVQDDEKFTYDVIGNRITVSLNGTTQLYTVYDGTNPYMDFNGSGQLTERYLTNPQGLNQFYGQVNPSGTVQWFLTDNLGSIRQVVDASGNILDAITYDPFGNILSQTNATNAPRFLYTGGAFDSITGTYLDGAREENPVDGRWLSPDPLGLGPDINPYRYSGNNPINDVDPNGLDADGITGDGSYGFHITNQDKGHGEIEVE